MKLSVGFYHPLQRDFYTDDDGCEEEGRLGQSRGQRLGQSRGQRLGLQPKQINFAEHTGVHAK